MESMGKRLWAIAIVLGTFFPMLSSCKRYSKTETVQRCEGQYGYAGVYLDIPEKEGYKLYDIGDIFLDNGMYCTSVIYSRYDEKTNTRDFLTDILTVDLNGEVQYTLEITKMQVVRAVFDQEYAFFAYSDQDLLDVQNGIMDPAELKADLVFFDKKTGDTTRVIHPQMKAESVFAISDGFVVAGERD